MFQKGIMMGRGLSELQKCILRLADKKAGKPRADATYADIRAEYYGVALRVTEARSADAAICRVVERLQQRGLVEHVVAAYSKWACVRLTAEGKRQARSIG